MIDSIHEYTAVFPHVPEAKEFAARISEPGWFVEEGTVVRKGRTVTWTSDRPVGYEEFLDMRETVGYYGSASGEPNFPPRISQLATLDGVLCRGGF